jgi:FHA domain
MTNDRYELHMTRGPGAGQSFAIGEHILTIGRDSLSDIVVRHPEISRQHALIIVDRSGAYQLQDLGSTNGTFLDGLRLEDTPIVLRSPQTITLGSAVSFIFRRKEDDVSAVPLETSVDEIEEQQQIEQGDRAVEMEEPAVALQQQIEHVESAVEMEEPVVVVQQPAEAAVSEEDAIQEESIAQIEAPPPRISQPQPVAGINSQKSAPAASGPNLVLGSILLLLCCSASILLFILLLGGDWLFRLAGFVP